MTALIVTTVFSMLLVEVAAWQAVAALVAAAGVAAASVFVVLSHRAARGGQSEARRGERGYLAAAAGRGTAGALAIHGAGAAGSELAEELRVQTAQLQEQATELEAVNEELAAAEGRLRSVIDSSLDAIVMAAADSTITGWSRRAEAIFGFTREEVLGRTVEETIIPHRYREAHRRGLEHYLATGEGPILNRRIEISALHRDGREFPVELTVAPAPVGQSFVLSAFIRDISEQKQIEERLAAEHAVTRVLAEFHRLDQVAPRVLAAIGKTLRWDSGAFWMVDQGADLLRCEATWSGERRQVGTFLEKTAVTSFGPGEGLPGRVWASREAIWISDVTGDPAFPRAALAREEGLHGAVAFPVQSGSQMLAVLEFYHREVLHPNPPLMEMVAAIGGDIGQAMRRMQAEAERDEALEEMERVNTELQRTNAALRERTIEAEEARRSAEEANRSKSEFLANMSHELRTPLNAIIGFTDLMIMGISGELSDPQTAHLERIRASSRHLLGLIEDVLDLAKVEAGRLVVDRQPGLVVDVVAAARQLIEPQAVEKGVVLEEQCDTPEMRYVGDADRARQILINLLSNAVKFTDRGGTVTLRCGSTEKANDGVTPLPAGGPWVFIRVEDSGIGIAPGDLESVFQPFVQADSGRTRVYGGTGLGLTISRRLARLMGGDVTAESEVGKGSCFTLWLPVSESTSASAHPVHSAASAAAMKVVGEALQVSLVEILRRVAERLRRDPDVPAAENLTIPELEDHQSAFLADVSQTLIILGQHGGAPLSLRDSSDLQRLIGSRHGAQRARLGWTESALRREFTILTEEVLMVAARQPEGEDEAAIRVLRRLIEQGMEVSLWSLRSIRQSPEGDQSKP